MTRRRRGPARTEVENDLRRLRTDAGLTQEALARMVGVTRRTIGSIERGEYVPSVTLALRLVCALGVPVDRIFWLTGQTPGHGSGTMPLRCPFLPPQRQDQPTGIRQLSRID